MGKTDIVKRFFHEVVEEQKIDVLDEIIHEEYQAKPISKTTAASKLGLIDESKLSMKGIPGIKKRQEELFEQFSNFNVIITDEVEDDNNVVIFYLLEFNHTGYWNGFAPTGKRISIAAVNLFKFSDDKIIEIKAILGTIDLLKQIGANIDYDNHKEVEDYLLQLKGFIYG